MSMAAIKGVGVFQRHYTDTPFTPPQKYSEGLVGVSAYIYTLINLEYVRYVYTSHTSYMNNVSNGTKVCSIPPPHPLFFYFLLEALVFPARCIIRELLFIVLYSHTLTGINNILQNAPGNNTCKINVIKNVMYG